MRQEVCQLKLAYSAQKADFDAQLEAMALERAYDRKRIAKLEQHGKPARTEVNRKHLDLLASKLLIKAKQGQRGVTYSEASEILDIGKSSVCKLRNLIAADPRFNVSWHPNKPNMKIITLKKFSVVNNGKSLNATFNGLG